VVVERESGGDEVLVGGKQEGEMLEGVGTLGEFGVDQESEKRGLAGAVRRRVGGRQLGTEGSSVVRCEVGRERGGHDRVEGEEDGGVGLLVAALPFEAIVGGGEGLGRACDQ
jgi:hypothetical protein